MNLIVSHFVAVLLGVLLTLLVLWRDIFITEELTDIEADMLRSFLKTDDDPILPSAMCGHPEGSELGRMAWKMVGRGNGAGDHPKRR